MKVLRAHGLGCSDSFGFADFLSMLECSEFSGRVCLSGGGRIRFAAGRVVAWDARPLAELLSESGLRYGWRAVLGVPNGGLSLSVSDLLLQVLLGV